MKKCKRYPIPRAFVVPTATESHATPDPAYARIEDYLDRIFAPVVDDLPYERRTRLRAQLRARLHSLTAEYIAAGRSPERAVRKAIEGIDSTVPDRSVPMARAETRTPGRLGARLLFGDETVPLPSARASFYSALVLFGAASLWSFLQLGGSPYAVPDFSAIVLPVIAGAAVGLRCADRPVLGTLYALLALIPVAFVLASLTQPREAGVLAMMQIVLWLPVGCFMAWCGSRWRPRIVSALRRYSGQSLP